MEALGDTLGQMDEGDRGSGQVGSVEDGQVASVPGGVVDIGHEPAVAARGGIGRDEGGLAGRAAAAQSVFGDVARIEVVAEQGTGNRAVAWVGRGDGGVHVTRPQTCLAVINPGELARAVVELLLLDTSARKVD